MKFIIWKNVIFCNIDFRIPEKFPLIQIIFLNKIHPIIRDLLFFCLIIFSSTRNKTF